MKTNEYGQDNRLNGFIWYVVNLSVLLCIFLVQVHQYLDDFD
jgi:hypothetical protein